VPMKTSAEAKMRIIILLDEGGEAAASVASWVCSSIFSEMEFRI
jgi:hypothetical protein